MTEPARIRPSGNDLYYCDRLIEGISAKDFACLSDDSHGIYFKNQDGIWFYHQYGSKITSRFVTKHAGSFEYLGGGYAKDAKTVFLQGAKIKSSHPQSFRVQSNIFAADQNAVYVNSRSSEGFQIWTDFEADSLHFFDPGTNGSTFFADRFHLYQFNGHFVQYDNPHHPTHQHLKAQLLEEQPDTKAWWTLPEGFEAQLSPVAEDFFTNEDFVFYRFKQNANDCPQFWRPNRDEAYIILPHANPATFKELNKTYGVDDTSVYCLGKKIAADPATFEALEGAFGRDAKGIWYNGFFLSDLDASDPQILTTQDSAFVHDHVTLYALKSNARIGPNKGYAHQVKPEKKGDAASIALLSNAFAKDKTQVYLRGEAWKLADPASFECLFQNEHTEFAKDKTYMYGSSGKTVFKKVNGSELEVLSPFWGKTKDVVVYFGFTGEVMRNVDPNTFEVLDDQGTAQDDTKYFRHENGVLQSRRR